MLPNKVKAAVMTGPDRIDAQAGRYHLYVALTCPWASRTLMGCKLKGLEKAISISIAEPAMSAQGWRFGDYPGAGRDSVDGAGAVGQGAQDDRQQ